mgnify:FL=1
MLETGMADAHLATRLAVLVLTTLMVSLAIGVPVRVVGWRATLAGVQASWAAIRRRRFLILFILVIGAFAGLWSFESVRELLGGLF